MGTPTSNGHWIGEAGSFVNVFAVRRKVFGVVTVAFGFGFGGGGGGAVTATSSRVTAAGSVAATVTVCSSPGRAVAICCRSPGTIA